ncbi:MAG: hypothetical protein PHT62_01085 [Desulfotomaculaceae bacterium]|nr:hypothetical protein [Desulfotomaculaceae bacterium]
MLLYQTHFAVTGLGNTENVNKMKKAILCKKGVNKVEITGPNRVTITYDPTKIIPGVLSSIMSSLGLRAPGG